MTTLDLHGRSAIVTGASRGIGLATAEALTRAGADVVITSRSAESAESAADDLNRRTIPGAGRAVGVGAHAVDAAAAQACIDRTLNEFGRIDILVNNAGTNPAYGTLVEQDHARFAKTFDVNVWAPLQWTALAVDAWMGSNGGAVVNVASIGGVSIEPYLGIYNATKAAMIHLTKQQAYELGPKVRVNAVAPGVVRTRLAEALWRDHEAELIGSLAMGRIGEPSDIGTAITFLASDLASWITGTTLVVDGGALLGDTTGQRSHSEETAGV